MAKESRTKKTGYSTDVIHQVLKASEPRPTESDKSALRIAYAVRFANKMAELIADDLKPKLSGITATPKREAGAARGKKQLDVNYSTAGFGLGLGISLKSVHIREAAGRYTHNMKRNEEELRVEAIGYHKRQPYAVMVGVLFLPLDSCEDGKNGPSSFASFVRHLRPYSGRSGPRDDEDRFERIYIALYDPEPEKSDLRFFDVEFDPPKNACPKRVLSYPEFLDAVYHDYLRRNSLEFRFADGEEEPLEMSDLEPGGEGE